jgi:glycosyltransferase involved in cell wall biosynthesis
MANPIVSVVIPTFNRADHIERCLDSALAQTYDALQAIVVDDASTDDTHRIVSERAARDARVRLVRHATNRGASAARNTGIRASQGQYVAFLDSDDEWLPEKLAKQLELFRHGPPSLGVVHCPCAQKFLDGRPTQVLSYDLRGDVHAALLVSYGVQTSTLVVRRRLFEVAGGFNEKLCGHEEWDMCIRLARHCLYDYVPEPLSVYHIHGGPSISGDYIRNNRGYLVVVELHQDEIRVKCGPDALTRLREEGRQRLLWAAEQCRWRGKLREASVACLSASLIPPVRWGVLLDAGLLRLGPRIYWRSFHLRRRLHRLTRRPN